MVKISSKKNNADSETKEEQRILASNAWHLARYLIEHDYQRKLPDEISPGQFLYWAEHYPELKADEKIKFVDQYAMLEKCAENVTARTLVATRIHGRGFFHAVFFTSVGKYLLFLSVVTGLFVYLLIQNTILSPPAFLQGDVFIPFYAAGLGACVFLLRVTQEKLILREFDPAFIPSHLIRLSLGILAGGSLVLFPEIVAEKTIDVGLEQGAFAFILGYAVDVFYAVLDNIGGRIKNSK